MESRLESREELLGNRSGGVRNAHLTPDLEIGDAERAATLLQRQRVEVDLLTNFRRVPGLGRFAQGGDGILKIRRVTAKLGGALAILVIASQAGVNLLILTAHTGIFSRF